MFKDYTMNQIVLPLDVEMKLQENDIAFHVHHLVESIPQKVFEPFLRNEGCPTYHPRMMLKMVLVQMLKTHASTLKNLDIMILLF